VIPIPEVVFGYWVLTRPCLNHVQSIHDCRQYMLLLEDKVPPVALDALGYRVSILFQRQPVGALQDACHRTIVNGRQFRPYFSVGST